MDKVIMQYEVIKKSSNLVHDWAGGYTAEIFLYPRDSDYRKKNFEVRVSAAFTTVDDAKFSDFSGFKRFISPTEGTMSIKHKDHYEKELKPFEIDAFGGSWDTSSDGIYHDFNLLLGKGWDGLIMSINNNRQIDVLPKLVGFAGVFACIRTMMEIDDTKIVELDKGDFLLFTLPTDVRGIKIRSSEAKGTEKIGFYWYAGRKAG